MGSEMCIRDRALDFGAELDTYKVDAFIENQGGDPLDQIDSAV